MANSRHKQSGATLVAAVILLLLLSVAVFLTVKIGLSEQRAATTDSRTKVARQVAESGIDHAIEYIRLNSATLLPERGQAPDSALWEQCETDDRDFPCGAIDSEVADSALRGRYYAFIGGVDNTSNAAAQEVDERSLPVAQAFTQVGNFPVTYNVGAVMCLLDKPSLASGNAQCTSLPAQSDSVALTLVSTGQIEGEAARSTISVGLTQYRIIEGTPNLPPVVASSVIEGLGNSTIVASPSGGASRFAKSNWGISAWTRSTLGALGDTASGSFQTCDRHEFMNEDGSATYSSNGVPICDNCMCPASSKVSSNGIEGKDMLDRDDTDTGVLKATDTALAPQYEFPCDLFQYVFGIQARRNAISNDTYSDTPPLCETQLDSNGNGVKDVVEYLNRNFVRVDNCDTLVGSTNAGGFYWAPNGCALSGGGQIGTPENPVVLVADSSFKNTGPTIFGIVFVRDPAEVYANANGGAGAAEYAPGGGTAALYGALIIEGPGKLNGGLKIISSPEVMKAILDSPKNVKLAKVPDSWSDSLSY